MLSLMGPLRGCRDSILECIESVRRCTDFVPAWRRWILYSGYLDLVVTEGMESILGYPDWVLYHSRIHGPGTII
jgi:hypothetical protein